MLLVKISFKIIFLIIFFLFAPFAHTLSRGRRNSFLLKTILLYKFLFQVDAWVLQNDMFFLYDVPRRSCSLSANLIKSDVQIWQRGHLGHMYSVNVYFSIITTGEKSEEEKKKRRKKKKRKWKLGYVFRQRMVSKIHLFEKKEVEVKRDTVIAIFSTFLLLLFLKLPTQMKRSFSCQRKSENFFFFLVCLEEDFHY